MFSLFTDTPNRRIVTRSTERAPDAPPATPQLNQQDFSDRLLSPHEIAILLVLACEPRRQQGDPADLRSLVDRGLVRLDAEPLAVGTASLSSDGCQIVSRLALTCINSPRRGRAYRWLHWMGAGGRDHEERQ